MTFRGLAVFSLATVFGSFESCQPPAPMRLAPQPPPRLSVPAPVQPAPVIVPPTRTLPAPVVEPQAPITNNPWKPAAEARDWTAIVIHHTATNQGSVESIHESHLAKEWLGIGYHFVIGNGNGMPDGEIEPTFRWREQLHGAHAGSEEYNQHGIGIALIGNFENDPPTAAQLAAIKRLVGVLKAEYEIENERVIGHSEVKATACPGKLFPLEEVSEAQVVLLPEDMPSAIGTTPPRPAVAASVRLAGRVREPRRSASLADHSGSRLQ